MARDGIDGAVMYPGMAGAVYGFDDQEVKRFGLSTGGRQSKYCGH
jgi:hypothetical protein